MNITKLKYFLWILIIFLFFLLFSSWNNEKQIFDKLKDNDVIKTESSANFDVIERIESSDDIDKKEVLISTNLIFAKINLIGGDISYLVLKKYLSDTNSSDGIVIFDKSASKIYFAQSGFFEKITYSVNDNYKHIFNCNSANYEIKNGDDNLYVNLKHYDSTNLSINKVYIFKNYSYEIDVNYYLYNCSNSLVSGKIYGFIKSKKEFYKNSILSSNIRTYSGSAVYTKEKPYKKITYNDLDSKTFSYIAKYGWIANLDNYFLSAWIPNYNDVYNYNAEKVDNLYILKYFSNNCIDIFPNEIKYVEAILFVGPKVKGLLNKIRQGLDLSIDYGIFWPIAVPIFIILSKIFEVIGNWGLSIILVTLVIKVLFFHLSSMSYKSIGNMKKLQPRLDLLKERYKDDKKMLSQAMMELYRKEQINPLSGCLPILIQIPVFISLYYVLLESVELRHANFIFWISDLSSKDPYYILPLIMCITMFLQQKLNPPIQDPLQAKIVLFMPFLFLFLFLNFPSGLILYWVVNNILSIFQQWYITRY